MKKSRKILVIFAVIGLVLSLTSMSYAYLRARKAQESTNNISLLRCLGVDFTDSTNAVSLDNAYPVSDTEGMKTPVYKFKITNKCNTNVYAKVNLETLSLDNLLDVKHLKVWFNNKNLDNPKKGILSNEEVFTRETKTIADATQSNNLMEITLGEYESEEFELRLWIDEETTWSEGQGKAYSGKITVSVSPNPNTSVTKGDFTMYAYVDNKISSTFPTTNNYNVKVTCKSFASTTTDIVGSAAWNGTKWLVNIASLDSGDTVCNVYFNTKSSTEVDAPNNWYQAADGTLLAAIRNDNVVGTAATSPGKEKSTASEKIFASAKDDYGTSFYFRGAVENNYVEFAGMCWRIVRVTGDSSIKLTLFNRNDKNVANPCSASLGDGLAFAKYDGTNFTTKFNNDWNLNQYTGFMYGTSNSVNTFAEAFQNNVDSVILTKLKAWYDLKLRNYNNMLADTIWCNDKNTTSTHGSTDLVQFTAYSRAAGVDSGWYYPNKGTGPTLVCAKINKTSVDPNLSRFTANDTLNGNGKLKGSNGSGSLLYKIGLLTYDEVAFAGGVLATQADYNNTTYYLYYNTGSWWVMTPFYANTMGDYSYVIAVTGEGKMGGFYPNKELGLRPAISLLASTEIKSGGTGTSTNPYVVKMS